MKTAASHGHVKRQRAKMRRGSGKYGGSPIPRTEKVEAAACARMSAPTLTTDREVAAGVLGKHASFRLIVGGEYGPSQIKTIIRHLEVTRDTLAEDAEPTDGDWAE